MDDGRAKPRWRCRKGVGVWTWIKFWLIYLQLKAAGISSNLHKIWHPAARQTIYAHCTLVRSNPLRRWLGWFTNEFYCTSFAAILFIRRHFSSIYVSALAKINRGGLGYSETKHPLRRSSVMQTKGLHDSALTVTVLGRQKCHSRRGTS